jgi:hypothetical protein
MKNSIGAHYLLDKGITISLIIQRDKEGESIKND